MSYNLMKNQLVKRSNAINHQKVAIVYDTEVTGELALAEAYRDERGLDANLMYPVALGTIYANATLTEMREGWLTAFGDWCVANAIEAVAVSPNCPVVLGDGLDDKSTSSWCSQALLNCSTFIGDPLNTYNVSNGHAYKLYAPTFTNGIAVATQSQAEGLLEQDLIESVDEVIEVGGVDITGFTTDSLDDYNKIAVDNGLSTDRNGNKLCQLPAFRIGWPKHPSVNNNVGITATQIRTMVQNSKSIANTAAYHKANTGVAVAGNNRTAEITTGSAAMAHHLVETLGYTNTFWGYRGDDTDGMSAMVTATGLSKYTPDTSEADFIVTQPRNNATVDSTHLEITSNTLVNSKSYVAHNGNTFPMSVGMVLDQATENPKSNTAQNIFSSGPDQLWDLEAGTIINFCTSNALNGFGPDAILAGAGAVMGSFIEPLARGVANGNATLQYLLKGYEVCAAKLLDASETFTEAEVWGDGLTVFVNDIPIITDEETKARVDVDFVSDTNAAYTIDGCFEGICGTGTDQIVLRDNYVPPEGFNSGFEYKISTVLANVGVNAAAAIYSSVPSTLGHMIAITEPTTTLVGQPFPFESVRITDKANPELMDIHYTSADFSVGIGLVYASGAIFHIDGFLPFVDGKTYTVSIKGIEEDYINIESCYAITPQPSLTVGRSSQTQYGPLGVIQHVPYVRDNTVNYPNNAVTLSTNLNKVIYDIPSRNTQYSTGTSLVMTKSLAQTLLDAEGTDTGTGTGNIGTGVSDEYTNSTNLPSGRDFGTKRYQNDGDIIPNYIHTDFPNR